MKLKDDGQLYVAFNMHLEDWDNAPSSVLSGYMSTPRIANYDSANAQMNWYY